MAEAPISDPNPPAIGAAPDIDPTLASQLAEREQTIAQRTAAQGQLSADAAGFDPEGAIGAQPTFNENVPQDHFNDLMKQAPLLLGLGAIGGAFGRVHGIAMIQSTNAMMKGLVQGSDEAYAKAREDYNQKYQEFKDKQKTWNDVYKAYANAYKGRIDADQKAVQAANAAVGIIDKDINLTKKQIGDRALLAAKIDNIHSEISHRSAQDVTAAMNAETRRKAEEDKANKDRGAVAKKDQKAAQDLSEASAQIDDLISQVQQNPTIVGGAGMVRRVGEVAGNVTGLSNSTAANDFQSTMDALLLKVPKLLTGSSKSAKDERARVDDIVKGLKLGSTPQNTISSLQKLKQILGAQRPDVGGTPEQPVEKVLNNVTYVKTGPGEADWAVKQQ